MRRLVQVLASRALVGTVLAGVGSGCAELEAPESQLFETTAPALEVPTGKFTFTWNDVGRLAPEAEGLKLVFDSGAVTLEDGSLVPLEGLPAAVVIGEMPNDQLGLAWATLPAGRAVSLELKLSSAKTPDGSEWAPDGDILRLALDDTVVVDENTAVPIAFDREWSLRKVGSDVIFQITAYTAAEAFPISRVEAYPAAGLGPDAEASEPVTWVFDEPGAVGYQIFFSDMSLKPQCASAALIGDDGVWRPVDLNDAAQTGATERVETTRLTLSVSVPPGGGCGAFSVNHLVVDVATLNPRIRVFPTDDFSVSTRGLGFWLEGGHPASKAMDDTYERLDFAFDADASSGSFGSFGRLFPLAGDLEPTACSPPSEIIEALTDWICVPGAGLVRSPVSELCDVQWVEFSPDAKLVAGLSGSSRVPGRLQVTCGDLGYQLGDTLWISDTAPASSEWVRRVRNDGLVRNRLCAYESEYLVSDNCRIPSAEVSTVDGELFDTDCDGLSDFAERCWTGTCWDGTCSYPHNTGSHDTDGDGWWDGWELCPHTLVSMPAPSLPQGRTLPPLSVPPTWFEGPLVRDILSEVFWEAGMPTAPSDLPQRQIGRESLAAEEQLQRESPNDDAWEPLGFKVVRMGPITLLPADRGGIADPISRFGVLSILTGQLVTTVLWENSTSGRSYAATTDDYGFGPNLVSVPFVRLRSDQMLAGTWVHERGHILGLPHNPTEITGLPSPLAQNPRTYNPIYQSQMSYAQSWRMEFDPSIHFSSGAGGTVDEPDVEEVGFLVGNTNLLRYAFFDQFYTDHSAYYRRWPVDAAGNEVVNGDCRTGLRCPAFYGCYQAPARPSRFAWDPRAPAAPPDPASASSWRTTWTGTPTAGSTYRRSGTATTARRRPTAGTSIPTASAAPRRFWMILRIL